MGKKRLFGSILLIACLAGIAFWRTDFFSLATIEIPLLQQRDPPHFTEVQWPQTFRYLGRGRQCFAFESEDGRYVLKFFNGAQIKPPLDRWWWPIKRTKRIKHWTDRVRIYPESYRIALENMPLETGLMIVHQGVSSVTYPTVEVIDKASRHFWIDLNKIPFVLQKKGTETFLHRLSRVKSSQEFEQLIDQFLSFHAKRISLSIADADRDVKHNYAWDGERILYIDPARFCRQENIREGASLEQAIWAATYRLRKWISIHAPDQLASFDHRLAHHFKN